MPEPASYSNRFQDSASVAAYESLEYGPESYSSRVWNWQRPVLEQIVRDFKSSRKTSVRLLDFACGTGRVTSVLEPLVDEVLGVDISESMVSLARNKCGKARFQVGDILSQPEVLSGAFDLITSFRFLLNVEPELRQKILHRLRAVIRPDGLLIMNVHGNSRSLRHPAIVWRRWRERSRPTGAMLNEMSPSESRELFHSTGLEVVREFGFGMLPPTIYRTPLRGLVEIADRSLAGENFLSNFSIDMMYVCRPV